MDAEEGLVTGRAVAWPVDAEEGLVTGRGVA